MGHRQAKVVPPLEPRADAASVVFTGGLVAGGPPSVLFARSARRR
jgi:hypothetical protein